MRPLFLATVTGLLAAALMCFLVHWSGLPLSTTEGLHLASVVGVLCGAYAGITSLLFR